MDRIKELLLKYLRAEISVDENAELEAWLAGSADNKNLFEEITDADQLAAAFRKLDALHGPEVWARVQGYADAQRFKPRKQIFFRVAAAAAVFIGLFIGSYFLFIKKSETSAIAVTEKKADVAPGTNKATLTLGNGSKIILDSAANGLLAKQNNTNIIKTDSGQLSYQNNQNNKTEKPTETIYNTLSTPRGGEYQLILPDGTKAWLNAASSITYPTAFNDKNREVSITGEVYFEVRHDDKKSFIVNVNSVQVQDIGTHFNINAYPDESEIKTTLLEGKIKIKTQNSEHILNPGEQENISGNEVSVIKNVDVLRVIAWQQGRFEFSQATIPVILRQISRWYDIDIKTEGELTTETFGGTIGRNQPLSDILKLLEANGLQFKLENKTLYVSNKTK